MQRNLLRRGLEILLLFSSAVAGARDTHGTSALAYRAVDGTLQYGLYANQGETNAVNRLPDFSHAGYEGGGVTLPQVATQIVLAPAHGDDTRRIQEAIDAVSAMPPEAQGFRGAVLLRAGRYQVSETLRIETDGVVLRGEGQDVLGTVIEATEPKRYTVIILGPGRSSLTAVDSTRRRITTPYVPVGATVFAIENAADFAVGNRIGIRYTRNQFWVQDLEMDQWGWEPEFYTRTHERRITALNGHTLTIDSPLVDVIQEKYGGGEIFRLQPTARIAHCAVEHLRLVSGYAGDTDEEHPWNAVRVNNVENAWVRGVTAVHFAYSAVAVGGVARNVTVQDCAFLDPKSKISGGRRYSFALGGSATNVLFQRCFSERGRHDFVTHSRVRGPAAFVDCHAQQAYNDSGPHHRWAAGVLFDNVYCSNMLAVENRGPSGTGHGWTGTQIVFWNCTAARQRCHAPKGGMNMAIGSKAERVPGGWAPDSAPGWWEHLGETVSPRSLYFQQLADRKGRSAMARVTWPEQRTADIHKELKAWAGRYAFQPSPLVTAEPTITYRGKEATLAVTPRPDVAILHYRWIASAGAEYVPAGSDAPTLTVPRPDLPDPERTFFCRIVTERGPYWSAEVRVLPQDVSAVSLTANDYVIGLRAPNGHALGYFSGGAAANMIGSAGGQTTRSHYNPILKFALPKLPDRPLRKAVLSIARHSDGDNIPVPHIDLYGLDPRVEGFALDETLWHQGKEDARAFVTFYEPGILSAEDPQGRLRTVDVTPYIRLFYDRGTPLVEAVYFRLGHDLTLEPDQLRRLSVYNQVSNGTGFLPAQASRLPVLFLTVQSADRQPAAP